MLSPNGATDNSKRREPLDRMPPCLGVLKGRASATSASIVTVELGSCAESRANELVYTRRYNIGFLGLERLHPFDSRKYGRAWRAVGRVARKLRDRAWLRVPRPASIADLAAVHDPAYLESLRDTRVLAAALELPFVRRLPGWAVRWAVLRPMRWAVAGSLVAARAALTTGSR